MRKKTEEQKRARKLRSEGLSINEIACKVGVAKSSVSNWVRDVKLTPKQKRKLDARNPMGRGNSQALKEWSRRNRETRLGYQKVGRELARRHRTDELFVSGSMLYWAEGATCKNTLTFSNSDVWMIRKFLAFLYKYFGVKREDISVRIACYLNNGLTAEDIETWWLSQLDLPWSTLRSMTICGSRAVSGKRKHVHKHGICAVRISSTEVVQKIFGSIKEIGEIEDPYLWLG